jgi:phosphoribosylaminoimidazole-succinocarboxamide synthase
MCGILFSGNEKALAVRNDLFHVEGKYEVGVFWERCHVADSAKTDDCCDWKS